MMHSPRVPNLLCLQNIANPIADVIFWRAKKIAVRIGFQSDPIDRTKTRLLLLPAERQASWEER